ncbi:FecR domain-containing protein [Marinilabiliaceae bacterium ANBcel2]|nr:FecR domain-containing protein [Marinilabiliaceae bacterium ANBcel2]
MKPSDINNREDLIVRYLCGEANSQEQSYIKNRLQNDPDFKKLYNDMCFIWENAANPSYNKEQDWQAIRERMGFCKKRKSTPYSMLMRIAAIIVIMLSVSTALWVYWNVPGYGRWVVYETEAQTDSLTLPDESMVFLNRNSSLKFKNAFAGDERRVILKGEGYFEVSSNPEQPFYVDVGNASVKVKGTAFHINEKGKNNIIELNVTQGVVEMLSQNNKLTVYEGEWAQADNSDIIKGAIANNNFLSWKTGIIEFNNASIDIITETLESHFEQVDSIYYNFESDIKITTRFPEPNLKEITNELSLHFNKNFELKNGILIISD